LGLRFHIPVLAGVVLAIASPPLPAQSVESAHAADEETLFSRIPVEDQEDDLPAELRAESAIYLQRRLGDWGQEDARKLLGEPLRRRDAFDKGEVTGDIYAYRDPTRRYREFELLFNRESKTLRAVFIYPERMTWDDCRELWGDEVNTTQLANGNVFRSYQFRRLDVLADGAGKVINLGIY
jgi:hypothetical protein